MMNEPRLEWTDILGFGMIYFGYLMFLIVLHIFTINNGGNTGDVLNTVFIVFLYIYVAMIIFGFVGIITQLLRWIAYKAAVPNWFKAEQKANKK